MPKTIVGTEICPNCQLLFPNFCSGCGEPVELLNTRSAACGRLISRERRPGARVVQVVRIEGNQVAILACPDCDEHFSPVVGNYPRCGTRICPRCQQMLCPQCLAAVEEEDLTCPQCGVAFEYVCPACDTLVDPDEEQCPQLVWPSDNWPIGKDGV